MMDKKMASHEDQSSTDPVTRDTAVPQGQEGTGRSPARSAVHDPGQPTPQTQEEGGSRTPDPSEAHKTAGTSAPTTDGDVDQADPQGATGAPEPGVETGLAGEGHRPQGHGPGPEVRDQGTGPEAKGDEAGNPARKGTALRQEVVERLHRVQELIRRSWFENGNEGPAEPGTDGGDHDAPAPAGGPIPPAVPGAPVPPAGPGAPIPPDGPAPLAPPLPRPGEDGGPGHHPAPWFSPHRGQGRILALLDLRPDISQRDLGYMLDMSRQALGELLSKLERNGLVTRSPSPEDRRVLDVHLTDEGREEAKRIKERRYNYAGVFDDLDETDLQTLDDLLGRIIDSWERHHPEDGGRHGDHHPPVTPAPSPKPSTTTTPAAAKDE